MLTDQFLDMCCVCLFSDKKEYVRIADSIGEILAFYKKSLGDIPMDLSQKFDLMDVLVGLKMSGKPKEVMIDCVTTAGKYQDFLSFLRLKSEEAETSEHIDEYCTQIALKKRFVSLAKEFGKLNKFVENFSTNQYDDIETALTEYENLISTLYVDLAAEQRHDHISKVSTLNFLEDDYNSVLDQLELNYSGLNTVTTGYETLNAKMSGGYNPARLYVIGGASGDGKSTFLLNNVKNAIEMDSPDPDGKLNVYGYITLENLLDESFLRLYTCWKKTDYDRLIKDLKAERPKMQEFLKAKMKEHNAALVMDYFVPHAVSVFDIRLYIQKLKEKYKNTGRIRALYIDYLDLVKSGKTFDLYRLELGEVALLLKAIAVLEDIPIITVTQLNREGYDKETFSLIQMSESIKKVEHSDFVALLKNQDEGEKVGGFYNLEIYIGKNRSGPKNLKVTLRSKFEQFLIEDGAKAGGMEFKLFDKPVNDGIV